MTEISYNTDTKNIKEFKVITEITKLTEITETTDKAYDIDITEDLKNCNITKITYIPDSRL